MKRAVTTTLLALFALVVPVRGWTQSVMSAAPSGVTVKGKLEWRVSGQTGVVGDGLVFALASDRQRILGWSPTTAGSYTTGGLWEIRSLRPNQTIVFVGFSQATRRLCWIESVSIGAGRYKDLGTVYASMSVPDPNGPASAPGNVFQLLVTIGWLAGEIANGSELAQIDALTERLTYEIKGSSPGKGSGLRLTEGRYSENDNLDSACRVAFGSTAHLADWSDLEAAWALEGGTVLDQINLSGDTTNALISRSGKRFYSETRHYFIARHDGKKPSGFLAHEQLGGYAVSLGSWYNRNMPVLCLVP